VTGLQSVGFFSGVGGIELGLERSGIQTVSLCEIDKSARAVLTHRFPGIPIFEDIRKVTGDDLRNAGAVPGRTILAAGFPCQDLSVSGRRAGLDHGARSGLFWEIDRILGEFPAAWVLLENVAGLLSAVCPCPGDGTCTDHGLAVRCPGTLHTVPAGPAPASARPGMEGRWAPSSGRWETAGMGTPTDCWTLSTSEYPSGGGVSSSLADVLEDPAGPHLHGYCLSPRAAAGILRRAQRRGRTLPAGLLSALTDLAGTAERERPSVR
jgi:hypothetical protein